MREKRCILAFALLLAAVAPAAAQAPKHACDMITEGEVGTLLGSPVRAKPPEFDGVLCLGYCPMRGENSSHCDFVSADGKVSLYLELDPPPFPDTTWPDRAFKYDRTDHRAVVEAVQLPSGSGVWYFRADQVHGFLEAFIGQHVWFMISAEGVKDGPAARHIAEQIVATALARYDAQ